MSPLRSLLFLGCVLAYASAFYYGGLDDDYFNRGFRLASYGMPAATNFGMPFRSPNIGGYPSFNRFSGMAFANPLGANVIGGGSYFYEDMYKKKK